MKGGRDKGGRMDVASLVMYVSCLGMGSGLEG